MNRRGMAWMIIGLLSYLADPACAQRMSGTQPAGPGVLMESLDPAVRKWYRPQELYNLYGWEQWKYSNYAREHYERYVDIALEGFKWYDIYGDYVTRGWQVYSFELEQPRDMGSRLFKNPKFRDWFNNVVISSASKGQYFTALTIGDQIRTTLTPLTFSTPTFNGVQYDFASDKYDATILASRISAPGTALGSDLSPPQNSTDFTTLVGVRGTVQLGDFVKTGITYVNAFNGTSSDEWLDNSLKGVLTTAQNGAKVRQITLRLSDDSPEDGEAGAMLFAEQIYIDGREADVRPAIQGGLFREGRREANGEQAILLTYDISNWYYEDERLEPPLRDVSWFERVSFMLVLGNDYRVEATSNIQLDGSGRPIFLPVAAASGNVKDATNQAVVRFDYGLPTGNEIAGVTLEVTDIAGFRGRGEYNVNRRHRRFPQPNTKISENWLSTDVADAFYATVSKRAYPWFAYGEAFKISRDYSTTAFIADEQGRVFYNDELSYLFEFVDDNDDQDRWPDWRRNPNNQRAGNDSELGGLGRGVFPGLDENNDFISDFNQNQNFQPDYDEPFLQHNVDPPEYLFGLDMNNNTVIDRFENDDLPDYPYRRDHRGYNAYVGVEAARGVKLLAGHLREWLESSDGKSRSLYGLVLVDHSFPGVGDLRIFQNSRFVRDTIAEDLLLWEQLPGTKGEMVPFPDPMVAPNTFIHTSYADLKYTAVPRLNIGGKVKYELYHQRKASRTLAHSKEFLGAIAKADYVFTTSRGIVLAPRLKAIYRHEDPFSRVPIDRKELTEIPSLIVRFPVLGTGGVDLGLEYTQFHNLVKKAESFAGEYIDDFQGLTYVLQFSNTTSYLGYRLASRVGFRQQTRYFKDRTKTGSLVFLNVFAGAE